MEPHVNLVESQSAKSLLPSILHQTNHQVKLVFLISQLPPGSEFRSLWSNEREEADSCNVEDIWILLVFPNPSETRESIPLR